MAQIFASEKTQATRPGTAPAKSGPDARLDALQAQADASPTTGKLAQLQAKTLQRMDEEELMQGKFTAQRFEDEEELQGKFGAPLQRMEEEELLQGKFAPPAQRQENGLPAPLAQGIQSLSGVDVSDVRVHRNSAKPAQIQAHAYAQGTDIHLAPGQERHLPHEAWHTVQQKQGRVQATTQLQGVGINDDAGLESEADAMGAKAAQMVKDTRT